MLNTRSLLVLVMLGSVVLPRCAVSVSRAQAEKEDEREAVEAIEKVGGEVMWVSDSLVDWLWIALLGEDPFQRVAIVCFQGGRLTDDSLKCLTEQHLFRCKQLQYVSFYDENRLTGKGLVQLALVPQIKEIRVSEIPLEDADLEEMKSLRQVDMLTLEKTKVTPTGARKLQRALPQCWIVVE